MKGLRFRVYSPPQVDRIWGIRGSYCNIPKATFHLLKGDYTLNPKPYLLKGGYTLYPKPYLLKGGYRFEGMPC